MWCQGAGDRRKTYFEKTDNDSNLPLGLGGTFLCQRMLLLLTVLTHPSAPPTVASRDLMPRATGYMISSPPSSPRPHHRPRPSYLSCIQLFALDNAASPILMKYKEYEEPSLVQVLVLISFFCECAMARPSLTGKTLRTSRARSPTASFMRVCSAR
jgi:hypothetical protein